MLKRQRAMQKMMQEMAGHNQDMDSLFTDSGVLWNQLHANSDGTHQAEAATGVTMKGSPEECRRNEQPQNPCTLDALNSEKAGDMQTVTVNRREDIKKADDVLQMQQQQIRQQKEELAALHHQAQLMRQAQQAKQQHEQQPGAAESAAAASPAAPSLEAPSPSPSGISLAAERPAAADHQDKQQAEVGRKDPATAAAAAATPQPAALNTTATTAAMAATATAPPAEPELTEAQLKQIEDSKKKAQMLRAALEKRAAQLAAEEVFTGTGNGKYSQASAPAAAAVGSASSSSGLAGPEEEVVAAPAAAAVDSASSSSGFAGPEEEVVAAPAAAVDIE